MSRSTMDKSIKVAIVGLGNCASSLIEGIYFYRQHPGYLDGLIFPSLGGYEVSDIEIIAAFDISALKVGRPIREAMYQSPNNFTRIPGVEVLSTAEVSRGPTLDGNPKHLACFVPESDSPSVDVVEILRQKKIAVLVNLLPTGSIEATEYYMRAAAEAGCAFINCIPTIIAQREDLQQIFLKKGAPLLGDDIKSQMGSTILHRMLLRLFQFRGAKLRKTSQVNIGGNTDFANFVYRAETKLVSKRKTLAQYVSDAECHVGHHYDLTRGNKKTCLIDVEGTVFADSQVRISVRLDSDDKPNSSGSVCDLIRIARAAQDKGEGGVIPEACAFYMKSAPSPMDELDAFELIQANWATVPGWENSADRS
jgi:myo-inositol-1-phosphate synthase